MATFDSAEPIDRVLAPIQMFENHVSNKREGHRGRERGEGTERERETKASGKEREWREREREKERGKERKRERESKKEKVSQNLLGRWFSLVVWFPCKTFNWPVKRVAG